MVSCLSPRPGHRCQETVGSLCCPSEEKADVIGLSPFGGESSAKAEASSGTFLLRGGIICNIQLSGRSVGFFDGVVNPYF